MAGRKNGTRSELLPGLAMSRRTWLVSAAAVLAGGAFGMISRQSHGASTSEAKDVLIENFLPSGKSQGTARVAKVVLPDAEWRKRLPRLAYEVTRHEDTEQPFTGALLNNHRDGIYTCVCCDTALFDSSTKFESGTGWPSFWKPISKNNVTETTDRTFGMVRTAVSCARCDAHLGHVFDDGPQPTGLRYCMNSVSLKFLPRV